VPNFLAGLGLTCSNAGPILASSFICLDAAASVGDIFNARMATAAGDVICGISQQGTDNAPNLFNALTNGLFNPPAVAAATGEAITTFGMGDIAPLQLGALGCSTGDLLITDGSGFGKKTTGAGQYAGALALQNGNAFDIISVLILSPGTKT